MAELSPPTDHEARPPDRLNVVFLSNLFPIPTDPTRGIFNLQLARELRELCDLTVMCPLPWFPDWSFLKPLRRWATFGQVPNSYEVGDIRVLSPKYPMIPRLSGAIQGRLMEIGVSRMIRRLHRSRPIDVIHALWLYPDAVAAKRIGDRLGVTVVPAALGSDVNRMFEESDKRDQIFAMLRDSRRIVVVSDALATRIHEVGVDLDSLRVIPNGVDASIFCIRDRKAAREALGLPQDARIVLFVGRLSPEKGVSTLLKATALASEAGTPFRLCLIGDGDLRGPLDTEVTHLGIGPCVRFVGKLAHGRIADWMAACDVFCLPSLTEGCPNVINEALACGRPVVASAVGGIPDMVDASCGMLVPPSQPEALSAAIRGTLAGSWDTDRIAGTVRSKSWAAAARKYEACLREAVVLARSEPARR